MSFLFLGDPLCYRLSMRCDAMGESRGVEAEMNVSYKGLGLTVTAPLIRVPSPNTNTAVTGLLTYSFC